MAESARRSHYQVTFAILAVGIGAYALLQSLVIPVLTTVQHQLHTTQDLGEGTTWLVDVFGPPRMDFSSREGFVLNAADYPMPAAH